MRKISIFPFAILTQRMHTLILKESQPAAPVWWATLCGFWLIFEEGKYLLSGPTVCTYLSYNSVCQCELFLDEQCNSFSVTALVIVIGLMNKIVGKCCFNLAFNKLILVQLLSQTQQILLYFTLHSWEAVGWAHLNLNPAEVEGL